MAGVRDPKALMAFIGRRKYGARRFQQMAAGGRRRAAAARAKGEKPKKTFRVGGGATFAAGVRLIQQGKKKQLSALLRAKTARARKRAASA